MEDRGRFLLFKLIVGCLKKVLSLSAMFVPGSENLEKLVG